MMENGSPLPEICSALLRIDFLSFLPEEELNCLAGQFTRIRAEKGSTLCSEGEPGDSFCIIGSGLAHVISRDQEGERLVAELKRGDFFGDRSLLTGEPRSATVRAALDVELFVLGRNDFEQLLYRNPRVAYHIGRIISSRNLWGRGVTQPPPPCFFSIIPSHPDLGCSPFAVRLARSAAEETGDDILIIDLEEQRGEVAAMLGARRTECPDLRLLDEFHDAATRRVLTDSWYASPHGITVLELPPAEPQRFVPRIIASLSPLLELLKDRFRLVLLVLPPEFTPITRRVLKLSDGVLFMISNSFRHSAEVTGKLAMIRETTEPLTVQLKVGTSHQQAGKGLFRAEIRERLELTEMPQIWWSGGEEKLSRTIGGLAREICRRRIGLVLGAGASRGWAHLGVLRVLEQRGIPVDMVAGSSIGAFIGALYAKSGSAEGAIDLAFSTFSTQRQVRKNIFDYCLTGGGVLKGKRILAVLQTILEDADFFDLKIPLSVVAVDLSTGQQVVIDEGSVSMAVRASISSPGIFRPFRMNGRWYSDGALINPLPVDVIIHKGADLVLASIVEKGVSEEWPARGTPTLLNTLSRAFSIMFAHATRDRAGDADIALYPDVSGYTWGDFHMGRELLKRGEEACLMKMDEIERVIRMKERQQGERR
jgi:NTE family protein